MLFQYPEPAENGSGAPQLEVEVVGDRWIVTVRVCGEVDLATAGVLDAGIEFGFGSEPPLRLIVQLSGVTFFSAAGLDILIGARNRAVECGTDLVLRAPSAIVLTILDVSLTRHLFRVEVPSTSEPVRGSVVRT